MNCIINVATGRYVKGQERLRNSLKNWNGQLLTWTNENQINSPLHKDNPYAFKVFAFDEAIRQGFERILWVDASIWAIADTNEFWNFKDYYIQEAGHWTGTWCNDRTLNYFGITRDEAMKMPMYGNGGFMALDFGTSIARDFFELWKQSMLDGMFIGNWEDHRHDMTCGSIIANQLNMKPSKPVMAYVGNDYEEPPNDTLFYAQGI